MAEVAAPVGQAPRQGQRPPQQQQQQQQQRTPPVPQPRHGKKRAAENGLENEQRLSKRFDLLNLVDGNGARLYIPVAGSSDAGFTGSLPQSQPSPTSKQLPTPVAPVTRKHESRRPRPPPPDDCMEVEETRHRVYIHDLAAELSDIESDEENPIFLSDIEKHLAKIPKHILMGPEPKPTRDNALVLYNVPSSLTVPEEQDNVRKAIVEARARLRETQANAIGEPDRVHAASVNRVRTTSVSPQRMDDTLMEASDSDAMDIDDY
ncbi:hypothetical protein BCR34DRAFT_494734 [Clohesyomyces aquaticus]|uniref:Uncharacterized protein n=1 Tax=Clohesyomyces aquaticus TaxID=1231657 RepID=A0A1Y1YQD5_9PLEO|nr:hypothetical protein BCR34DRAFT_494734 [Clohesyomyces aquaticus]